MCYKKITMSKVIYKELAYDNNKLILNASECSFMLICLFSYISVGGMCIHENKSYFIKVMSI